MDRGSIIEAIQNNWGSFLLGYIIGSGSFPILVEQISQAF